MKWRFKHLTAFTACRGGCVSILLLFLANGCSSIAAKELVSKKTSESFCLVLVRPSDVGVFRVPIKIDNHRAKLKSGSFVELELSPGIHFISVRAGYIFSRDFPPASTNVSGSAGERRYFSYVRQYSPDTLYILDIETPVLRPIQAAWKEITQQEFESQFPHAKFND